jgi:outer membrane lipoprotein LolB
MKRVGVVRWAVLLGSLALSACSSVPPVTENGARPWLHDKHFFKPALAEQAERHTWRYDAKVGVRAPNTSDSANLVWQFERASHKVRLFGPLGAGAVTIEFDPAGGVISDNKGNVRRGRSAERLLNQVVGWPIPLESLTYWLFALPNPGSAYQYQLNEDGHVSALRQQGWEIHYTAYKQFGDFEWMPRKMVARKTVRDGEVVVRLVSKSWQ